jgi:hypothetical protein
LITITRLALQKLPSIPLTLFEREKKNDEHFSKSDEASNQKVWHLPKTSIYLPKVLIPDDEVAVEFGTGVSTARLYQRRRSNSAQA